MSQSFLNGRITLHPGDCLDVLATLPENSIDSCVTDPPYHLVDMTKRYGKPDAKPCGVGTDGSFRRLTKGFMGKQWDGGDIAQSVELWSQVFRVLKPGAHLLAFGGTRTYHRMACAIEDAGFEIRDCILFLYGSGFPKSHSVDKVLDAKKERCTCPTHLRDMRNDLDTKESLSGNAEYDLQSNLHGCGNIESENRGDEETKNFMRPLRCDGQRPATVEAMQASEGLLQPQLSSESPCGSSAPIRGKYEGSPTEGQKVRSGKSGMERRSDVPQSPWQLRQREIRPMPAQSNTNGKTGRLRDGASSSDGYVDWPSTNEGGMCASQGPPTTEQPADQSGTVAMQSQPQISGAWPTCGRCGKPIVPDGYGTALKPACEPIVLARKPLSERTVAANVLRWGTGAINVDGCRVEAADQANLTASREQFAKSDIHTKTNIEGRFLASQKIVPNMTPGRWPANVIHDGSEEVVRAFPESGPASSGGVAGWQKDGYVGGKYEPIDRTGYDDNGGSAARFFYTAKADSDDRLGSFHPTVKPLDLMQYLVRLITPKGGMVLDLFAGTGTTGEAAWREGMKAVLIEREAEYQADIRRRMELCLSGPDERQRESIKARLKDKPLDHGPLFGAVQ